MIAVTCPQCNNPDQDEHFCSSCSFDLGPVRHGFAAPSLNSAVTADSDGAPPSQPITARYPLHIFGAVGLAVGSFMPWVSVTSIFGTIDVAGTAGDGKITAALGVVAALLFFFKKESPSCGTVSVLGTVLRGVHLV